MNHINERERNSGDEEGLVPCVNFRITWRKFGFWPLSVKAVARLPETC